MYNMIMTIVYRIQKDVDKVWKGRADRNEDAERPVKQREKKKKRPTMNNFQRPNKENHKNKMNAIKTRQLK